MIGKSIKEVWHRLLFQPIEITQYAALRIGLGVLITLYLLELLQFNSVHFSQQGWLGASQDLFLYNSGSWSILFLIGDKTPTWFFFLGAIFCSSAFTVGFLTKWSGWATLVALISIWNRNPLILDGDDAVLRITLFYLLLSPCGRVLSIDSRFRCPMVKAEIWPLRLIQFQLAFIYFVSGWVKFHSSEWQNGTILEYVLVHPEYSRWDFSGFFRDSFILMVLSALAFTIKWWELLFPLLLVWRKSRVVCLLMGIVFHLGLLIFMNLRWFSWIMLILYIAFIPNRYFSRFRTVNPSSIHSTEPEGLTKRLPDKQQSIINS